MQILPLQGISNTTAGSQGQSSGQQSTLFANLLSAYGAGSATTTATSASGTASAADASMTTAATGTTTAAQASGQADLMNLKLTREDIAALHDKLQTCGFSDAEISDMETAAATDTGMTWGQLMTSVQKKVRAGQSDEKKDISTNDQAQLLGLFGQLGFVADQSQQLVDSLAKGDAASVWSAVQGKAAGLGSDSAVNLTGSELSALARGLNLSETAQNRLTNLLESATAEKGGTGSNVQTAMGLVQNEISAQQLEERQSMAEFRQAASGVLSQALQNKSAKERSDIHEDDVARKAAQAVAMRAESKTGAMAPAAAGAHGAATSLLADVPEAGRSPLASSDGHAGRTLDGNTARTEAKSASQAVKADSAGHAVAADTARGQDLAGSGLGAAGAADGDADTLLAQHGTAQADQASATVAAANQTAKMGAEAAGQRTGATAAQTQAAEAGQQAVTASVVGQAQASVDLSQGNPVFLSQLQAAAHATKANLQQQGQAEGEADDQAESLDQAAKSADTARPGQEARLAERTANAVTEAEASDQEGNGDAGAQHGAGQGQQDKAASKTRLAAGTGKGQTAQAQPDGSSGTPGRPGVADGTASSSTSSAASTDLATETELAEGVSGQAKAAGHGQAAVVADGMGQQGVEASTFAKTSTASLASQTARQLENGLLQNLGQGTRQLTLTLTPEGLGDLNVTLTIKDKDMQAVIRADRPETAALLQDQVAHIKQSLADQGLKVTRFDVRTAVGQDGQQQAWQGFGQQEQFSEQRETMERLRDSMRLAQRVGLVADGVESMDASILSTLASRSSGLDLFA